MGKGVFMMQARRCGRCGRILVSRDSVSRGYGRQCRLKMEEDAAQKPLEGQTSLFDCISGEELEVR